MPLSFFGQLDSSHCLKFFLSCACKNVKYCNSLGKEWFISEKDSKERFLGEKSLKNIQKEVVKRFLDIAILCVLRKKENLNGNQIRLLINKKFGIFLRPGSVYSTLYALERENLIRGVEDYSSRTYSLTPQGLTRYRDIDKIVKAFDLLMIQLCGDEA